ncbi:MAG: DUF1566 domain-containing protein [Candidatus Binatia bacterium]
MHAIILVFATVVLALWPAGVRAQCCDRCEGDFNGDGKVTVDEILTAVNNALTGCPTPGPRFVDNGDGTITDASTRLVWEKKSADGSIHDQDRTYTWSSTGTAADGTAFTTFLATLNQSNFAGHNDWRMPSVTELRSLVDYARFAPAIDPLFNTACAPGCTVLTCSCTTILNNYWSSTTAADTSIPGFVWTVDPNYGILNLFDKTLPFSVRAVRGS